MVRKDYRRPGIGTTAATGRYLSTTAILEAVAGPSARSARDTEPQDRQIRRTWWALSGSFLILAILAAGRLVLYNGQPADWLLGALVPLAGFAAVLHRQAVGDREMGRRGEAEGGGPVLAGLAGAVV